MSKSTRSIENHTDNHGRRRIVHPAWIILAGCCCLQIGGVGAIMVSQGVFFVPVCNELGFTRAEFSLWVSVHSILGVVFLPIAGRLYARYNFRVILTVSAIAVAIAAALMGTYTELWQFIFSGVIYGTFGMMVWLLPYTTLVSEWFDKKTGFAMSIPGCASALAGAVFSPLFNMVIENLGWRACYFIQAGIVLVFILPWSLFVFRLRPRDAGLRPYGAEDPVKSSQEIGETIASDSARLRKKLLTSSFVLLFLFTGVASMLGSGYDSHLPGIGISYRLTAVSAAFLVTALETGSFCSKLITGVLNDVIGVKKTTLIELVVVGISLMGIMASRGTSLMLVAAFFFGTQDTLGGISAPLILRELFGKKDYVQMNAWLRAGFSLFGAFAVPLVGLSYDCTGVFDLAMIGGIVLSMVGIALILIIYGLRKNPEAPIHA